jgi:hypothetical protein
MAVKKTAVNILGKSNGKARAMGGAVQSTLTKHMVPDWCHNSQPRMKMTVNQDNGWIDSSLHRQKGRVLGRKNGQQKVLTSML